VSRTLGLATTLGIGGIALTVVSVVPLLGDRETISGYGNVSPGVAVLEALTGAALFAAAATLATTPRHQPALATFFVGVAWFGASWAGWRDAPTALRNAGVLLVPLLAPASLLVVSTLLPARRARAFGITLAAVAVGLGVLLWLVRDPFADRHCWRDCEVHAFAPFADAGLARALTQLTLVCGFLCGVAVFVLSAHGLRTRRPAARAVEWALGPGVAVGVALALSSLVLVITPEENPRRALFLNLFAARALTLTAFAAGLVTFVTLRRRYVRAEIRRLTHAGATGRDLARSLAHAFDDPELQVGYPITGGTVVDAEGQPTGFGDSATRIVRGGDLVALIGSPRGALDTGVLDTELGPAGRLALANERLRAEQLARLRELADLRRRIVATGDAERQRLERDLHDGAQQRLLALTIDLKVALARAESLGRSALSNDLRLALATMQDAVGELRTIAHGIFPAVLSTSGLVAAVESLADARPMVLRVAVPDTRRYPPDVETAAYMVVFESTGEAIRPVEVQIGETEGRLVITVDDAPWNGGVVAVEDRVGAAGGTVERSARRLRAVLPTQRSS
jgi:signal transduction histidine kinase